MLFDTTSSYFEGEGPGGVAEYGYSRDHRSDRWQMVVGLLMTREGVPVCHRVFPGNTVDAAAFQQVLGEMKPRFGVQRVVLVGDRGLVSEATLEKLDLERMDCILGMPLRRFKVSQEVLSRGGRYHQVADNVRVKEVWVEGERFILSHNPQAAERDRIRREEIVVRLQERLPQGGLPSMLKSRVYRRFLRMEGVEAHIDPARLEADAKLDGKWILTTNTLIPSDEVALAYKGLWRVEQAFRHLKPVLSPAEGSWFEVRPVLHWTTDRVRSHVLVCFLALVLEPALQRKLAELDPQLSYSQVRRDLDRLRAVAIDADGSRYLLGTELRGEAHAAFQSVGLQPPPHLQPLN